MMLQETMVVRESLKDFLPFHLAGNSSAYSAKSFLSSSHRKNQSQLNQSISASSSLRTAFLIACWHEISEVVRGDGISTSMIHP